MSWKNAFVTKFSNDVEKYEIEVTKIGQKNAVYFDPISIIDL